MRALSPPASPAVLFCRILYAVIGGHIKFKEFFSGLALILTLIFLIFGVLGVLVFERGWDYYGVLGGIVSACGALIVVSQVRSWVVDGERRILFHTFGMLLGFGFVVGAILYAVKHDFKWLIAGFGLPVIFGFISAGVILRRRG